MAGSCGHPGTRLASLSAAAEEGEPGLVLHGVCHAVLLSTEDVGVCVLRGVLRHACLLYVYVAPRLGVDDVGVRVLRGGLRHACLFVELDHSFSLDLFLRVHN